MTDKINNDPAGSPSGGNAHADGINRRSVRNFLLQPFLQVKLGLYSTILAFGFAGVISWLVYIHLNEFANVVIQLTDAREEVLELLFKSLADMRNSLLAAIVLFLVLNIGVSVFFTHRMVGPTIAFRRLIRNLIDGHYGSEIKLRDGDAFLEVADELNHLSRTLAERHGDEG